MNEAQIIRVRDQVAEITGGKLDILVNNAGQTFLSVAADLDMKRVLDLYDVNIFGAMLDSVAGVTPYPFGSTYGSSKAALHAYGNTLRIELSPFNIKVVNLCTGSVKSDIIETKLNSSSRHLVVQVYRIYSPRKAKGGGAMSAEDYAKNVVPEALKANPRAWLWEGSKSWFVWTVDTFLPRTAFDNMMKGWYGMDHIHSELQT
ncbi:hypothetical protein F5146DRAFT_1133398 [Armillaria mellea]|nr:hypothetical protein F5146DRAFT_1133398 [Armillaria mellea]